jgi:hypothetical protein
MNEVSIEEYMNSRAPNDHDDKTNVEELHEIVGSDPGVIRTYSGALLNPLNPDPDAIRAIDIAHALGNTCRYGGHCPRFYSVAEHSILVRNLMTEDGHDYKMRFAALLHDAEEAYMADMCTPIKRSFPDYISACENLRWVIWKKFGLEPELYATIKPYDQKAYETERKRLWTKGSWHTYKPQEAKHRWLEQFNLYASLMAKAEAA